MIRDLKSLYVLVVDNKVLIFDTNLKSFVLKINEFDVKTRNYDYYYRKFKETHFIEFQTNNNKTCYLQKLL